MARRVPDFSSLEPSLAASLLLTSQIKHSRSLSQSAAALSAQKQLLESIGSTNNFVHHQQLAANQQLTPNVVNRRHNNTAASSSRQSMSITTDYNSNSMRNGSNNSNCSSNSSSINSNSCRRSDGGIGVERFTMNSTAAVSSSSMQQQHQAVLIELAGQNVVGFNVAGEPRLCLPHLLSTVLQTTPLVQIEKACTEFHVYLSSASLAQLRVLRSLGALRESTQTCGLITRSQTERLWNALNPPPAASTQGATRQFLDDYKAKLAADTDYAASAMHNNNTKSKNPSSSSSSLPVLSLTQQRIIPIQHRCFGRCRGHAFVDMFINEEASCIQCDHCGVLLSPRAFVLHAHSKKSAASADTVAAAAVAVQEQQQQQPPAEVKGTCHWGFDAARWRQYVHINWKQHVSSSLALTQRQVGAVSNALTNLSEQQAALELVWQKFKAKHYAVTTTTTTTQTQTQTTSSLSTLAEARQPSTLAVEVNNNNNFSASVYSTPTTTKSAVEEPAMRTFTAIASPPINSSSSNTATVQAKITDIINGLAAQQRLTPETCQALLSLAAHPEHVSTSMLAALAAQFGVFVGGGEPSSAVMPYSSPNATTLMPNSDAGSATTTTVDGSIGANVFEYSNNNNSVGAAATSPYATSPAVNMFAVAAAAAAAAAAFSNPTTTTTTIGGAPPGSELPTFFPYNQQQALQLLYNLRAFPPVPPPPEMMPPPPLPSAAAPCAPTFAVPPPTTNSESIIVNVDGDTPTTPAPPPASTTDAEVEAAHAQLVQDLSLRLSTLLTQLEKLKQKLPPPVRATLTNTVDELNATYNYAFEKQAKFVDDLNKELSALKLQSDPVATASTPSQTLPSVSQIDLLRHALNERDAVIEALSAQIAAAAQTVGNNSNNSTTNVTEADTAAASGMRISQLQSMIVVRDEKIAQLEKELKFVETKLQQLQQQQSQSPAEKNHKIPLGDSNNAAAAADNSAESDRMPYKKKLMLTDSSKSNNAVMPTVSTATTADNDGGRGSCREQPQQQQPRAFSQNDLTKLAESVNINTVRSPLPKRSHDEFLGGNADDGN